MVAILEIEGAKKEHYPRLANNKKIAKLLYYLSLLIAKDFKMTKESTAYRKASMSIGMLKYDVCNCKKIQELDRIPFVGKVIAKNILSFCEDGRLSYLEKILKRSDPMDILLLVDGIDEKKARTIIDMLNISSYEDLIKNATRKKMSMFFERNDPRIADIVDLVELLPSWLSYKRKMDLVLEVERPTTEQLLEWDNAFRENYPFSNDEYKSWNADHIGGSVVCSYSHSAGAQITHSIGDWVNIVYENDHHSLKWVVLTSKFGELKGKRIVMGEEDKSKLYYLQ